MRTMLFFFIFASGLNFAQTITFANSLNNLSKDQLKIISDDIISGYNYVYNYKKTIDYNDGEVSLIYYNSDIKEKDILEDLKSGFCSLCTEVKFKKYFKGENSDLEIKGNETYSFYSVEGKYLDLSTWWIKHFAPSESKESLLNNTTKRYIKTPEINIRFTKNLDIWEIQNIH